jgi:hypothetical protein
MMAGCTGRAEGAGNSGRNHSAGVADSLLEAGYDIRTIQEPLGHRDVSANDDLHVCSTRAGAVCGVLSISSSRPCRSRHV